MPITAIEKIKLCWIIPNIKPFIYFTSPTTTAPSNGTLSSDITNATTSLKRKHEDLDDLCDHHFDILGNGFDKLYISESDPEDSEDVDGSQADDEREELDSDYEEDYKGYKEYKKTRFGKANFAKRNV